MKAPKVWLGEGLGSLPKWTYEKAIRLEFVDLAEFRPKTLMERWMMESETQKVVVLRLLRRNRNLLQIYHLDPMFGKVHGGDVREVSRM